MPLYEYECFLCGQRFERIQKVNDQPVSVCPSCGGSVRRLLGVPALQFKGTGWYITDYGKGSGGRTAAGGETSTPPPGGDKPASSSGESKPAEGASTSKPTEGGGHGDAKPGPS